MLPDKAILMPLHIKQGLMKQYVKSFNKSMRNISRTVAISFRLFSHEKIKAGVFDERKLRQLLKDKGFTEPISPEKIVGSLSARFR